MDNQHAELEERLDESGRAWSTGGAVPAPGFLAAVRRRRTVRRARAAGLGVLAVVAVASGLWLGQGWLSGPDTPPDGVIAKSTDSARDDTIGARDTTPGMFSVAHLARLNHGTSLEDPVLPRMAEGRGGEPAMRLMDSRKASAFDTLLDGA